MNWKSYSDLIFDIHTKLLPKLPPVSAVYGIPRSGVIPAYVIAQALNVPLAMVGMREAYSGDRVPLLPRNYGVELLVDDSIYKGGTLKKYLSISKAPCVTVAIYAQKENVGMVDYYAELVEGPRVFEWNLFNSKTTENTIFDIDGVLCLDPPMYDDDGPIYQNYIANAVPYLIPNRTVHSLCTGRISRWREITEKWLSKYGISYNTLIMNNTPSAQDRRVKGKVNEQKAEWYLSSKAILFVESHDHNAAVISSISGKDVVSIESKKLFRKGAAYNGK